MLFITVAGTIIVIATLIGIFAVGGLMHVARKQRHGWPHLIIAGIVLTVGVQIALSGRNMSMGIDAAAMDLAGSSMSGLAQWVTRLVSMVCAALALERIAAAAIELSAGNKVHYGPPGLLVFFLIFWVCGTLFPATIAPHGGFGHDMLYPLLFGIAYHLVDPTNVANIIRATRNALMTLAVAGMAAIAITPNLVMDFNYTQGFIPGLPRFAGLTPHPVSCGMLTQITMFFVACYPYEKKQINIIAWLILTTSLFLTQSKTAWLSVLLCFSIFALANYRKQFSRALLNPSRPGLAVGILTFTLLGFAAPIMILMFSDIGAQARAFLASSEGAQLVSLTGRDIIWDAVFSEWQRYPVFGYGSDLLNFDSRLAIGMPNAIHGHNQFVDTLGRAGLVGAVALAAYVASLTYWSWRYSHAFKGLPLVLYIMLFLRGVSEVPLTMYGYGAEFIGHLLLIGILCGAHAQAQQPRSEIEAELQRRM